VRACHRAPATWLLPRPARAAVDAPALALARFFPASDPAHAKTWGDCGKEGVSAMRRGLSARLLMARERARQSALPARPPPTLAARRGTGRGRRRPRPPQGVYTAFCLFRRSATFCAVFACAVLRTRCTVVPVAGGRLPTAALMRGADRGEGVISNPPKSTFPRGEPSARGAGGQARGLPLLPEQRPPSPLLPLLPLLLALHCRRERGRGAFPTRGQAGGQLFLSYR